MTSKYSRRTFLAGSSAIATSLVVHSARSDETVGANDRINIGVIGLGSRGFNLIDDFLKHDDCQIVAICDVSQEHYRDRSKGDGRAFGCVPAAKRIEAAYAKKSGNNQYSGLTAYEDYRKLIERSDIDAVVVATPDHWHALCTLTALKADKDVYCEKPVTHLFSEGQLVYREVEKRKAIFQTGSQQRSDNLFRRTAELARNGVLGDIQTIEVGLPPGYDMPMGPHEAVDPPADTNYDFWCGPSEVLPYMRARHHRWWRGHRAYGGGVLMDWIGHHNDIAHWAIDMDKSGPTSVEAVGWEFPSTDVYNTPSNYAIRCEYQGGIESTISSSNKMGLKLIGKDGWVWVTRGKIEASDQRWVKDEFNPGSIKLYKSDNHSRNFLDCMRSRKACIAPAETGHRSISPGHLGYVANQLGKKLKWDAESETIIDDMSADKLLKQIKYRPPWAI